LARGSATAAGRCRRGGGRGHHRGLRTLTWRFRKAVALALGGAAGLGDCLAGALLWAVVCRRSDTGLTLAGRILWPLCWLAGSPSA
jgi:hypothetical protein